MSDDNWNEVDEAMDRIVRTRAQKLSEEGLIPEKLDIQKHQQVDINELGAAIDELYDKTVGIQSRDFERERPDVEPEGQVDDVEDEDLFESNSGLPHDEDDEDEDLAALLRSLGDDES